MGLILFPEIFTHVYQQPIFLKKLCFGYVTNENFDFRCRCRQCLPFSFIFLSTKIVLLCKLIKVVQNFYLFLSLIVSFWSTVYCKLNKTRKYRIKFSIKISFSPFLLTITSITILNYWTSYWYQYYRYNIWSNMTESYICMFIKQRTTFKII